MQVGKSSYYDPVTSKNTAVVSLYYELVSRHDHLRDALGIYRSLEEIGIINDPIEQNSVYRTREALIWYLSIEFHSRFLSDPSKRHDSKRCLRKLVNLIQEKSITDQFEEFLCTQSKLIGYIRTQRKKYLAHADLADWDYFPRVFGQDYKELFDSTADILDQIGIFLGSNRICARKSNISNIFDIKSKNH